MTAALVEEHVETLGRSLRGPAALRRSMLREVRDGLHDATDAHVDAGLSPEDAAARAVAEFGTVDELAACYQAELTARQGRTSAVLAMLAFPATALGWDLMWRAGVKWTSSADAGASALVRSLAWWEGATAVAVAVLAAVLLVHTYLRHVPPRRTTGLIGVTAALGALVEAGLAVAMTVLNGHTDLALMTQNATALPAYLISAAVLATVLTAATRTIRSALA